MLRRIDRVIIRVPNVASAVRYYRDVLQMPLIRQEERLASFQLGHGPTELVLHSDPDLPSEAVYYRVDDVRDLYRRREALQLNFVQSPQRVARGYRAAVKDPFGTILQLLDRVDEPQSTSHGDVSTVAASPVEDAKPPAQSLFAGVEPTVSVNRTALIQAYEAVGRTADDLPYTPQFERLHRLYSDAFDNPKPSRTQTWRHLLNLRKGGKLPKLGEARSAPPNVTRESIDKLTELLGDAKGRRDRLPYTPAFDRIVEAFNRTQPRPISPHLVWRLVARLAK